MESQNSNDLSFLGVTTVDVVDYEANYEDKVNRDLEKQQEALEWRRLAKTREAIRKLQERIDSCGEKVAVSRIAKLYERMEDLREEEQNILIRVGSTEAEFSATFPENKNPQIPKVNSTTQVEEEENEVTLLKVKRAKTVTLDLINEEDAEDEEDIKKEIIKDDGEEDNFRNRLFKWINEECGGGDNVEVPPEYIETVTKVPLYKQCQGLQQFPNIKNTGIEGCDIPKSIWNRLLDYQREGVKWIINLFNEEVGGILGDEMGLGKTIQVIASMASLQVSRKLSNPILIVCPATVMRQWISEFHTWWPPLRIHLIHSSTSSNNTDLSLIRQLKVAFKQGHVIITSYGHLQNTSIGEKLLEGQYSCVVLDEGHKIRNPSTEITTICKSIKGTFRLILSGTPIQNNLIELWSLMDFCYPGRLGALNVFKNEIARPISVGGYVNASSLQVQTSYKCACMLRDLVSPFLLRRVKSDVAAAASLPSKQEQVLFCQLTEFQRILYEYYLQSEDVVAIMNGRRNLLAGIDILRKICNHPDLLDITEQESILGGECSNRPSKFEDISGKLNVLRTILRHWWDKGHKVLLFCQTRQMLNIIEDFIISEKYPYLRMDGTTSITDRSELVDKFNERPFDELFIFLLTTRVGGLGINLTGADRVLIYDPDWNPSTDMQARERAWRLGQTRPVTIYRMLTVGTIEEKIYHRQIYKQFLTNRILSDPKQSRFFKTSDINDLFSFGNIEYKSSKGEVEESETTSLIAGLEDEEKTSSNNRNILDGIINVSGLHSALEHERLFEKPRSEMLLVEREADKRAKEAIQLIVNSSVCGVSKSAVISTGLTASSILSSIRQRKLVLDNAATADTCSTSTGPLNQVIDRLFTLFSVNGNICSSEMIAKEFNYLPKEDALAFRRILKSLATLKDGQWTLMEKWRKIS